METIDTHDTLSQNNVADQSIFILAIVLIFIAVILFLFFILKPTAKAKTDLKSELIPGTLTASETKIKSKKSEISSQQESEINLKTKPITLGESYIILQQELNAIAKPKPEVKPQSKPEPKPEPEVIQSQVKFIGYNPLNVFEQTEPLSFPYVVMPKSGSVIKFPKKGRRSRKGFTEERFLTYVKGYFSDSFKIFDDRYIVVKNSAAPFEPDLSLIDERGGINIFLDIEIDEPYEGINDISKRKSTHYSFADRNRNNAFKNRGWITIRFAEIQIHQAPDSCCLFIANVISNINPSFKIPLSLNNTKKIVSIAQWTKEEADEMSRKRFREEYLGIDSFGNVPETRLIVAEENEIDKEVEEKVSDDPIITTPTSLTQTSSTSIFQTALEQNKYVAFLYENMPRLIKPISFDIQSVSGYCYVKNTNVTFLINRIVKPVIKDHPFILEATGPNIGLNRISSIVGTAIQYNKYIRMRYTRSAWTNYAVIPGTGELIIVDQIEAEESIRTISNIQLTINTDEADTLWFTPNENYISSYCHKREDKRTFRYDRIGELAILNL